MHPEEPNPYDFINNQQPSTRGGPGSAFLQDPKNKLLAIIIFVVGFLTLVILVFAFILSLGGSSQSALLEVSGHQTELARVSALGLKDTEDRTTLTSITTLNAFITSDLAETTSYLASNGGVLGEKEMLAYITPSLAEDLSRADERSAYDETLLEILDSIIDDYKTSLQKALDSSPSPAQEKLLTQAAENILTYAQ